MRQPSFAIAALAWWIVCAATVPAQAAGPAVAQTRETQAAMTPDPALAVWKQLAGAHDSKNAAYEKHVTEAKARLKAHVLVEKSEVLRELVKNGRLRLVPALDDMETAHVAFLD